MSKNWGGRRDGAGLKPKIGIVKRIAVALSADEAEAYKKQNGNPELFRFLLRQHSGLCLHGIQERDDDTGLNKCFECGLDNPPDYSKYFKGRVEPDNEPNDDFPL